MRKIEVRLQDYVNRVAILKKRQKIQVLSEEIKELSKTNKKMKLKI